MRDWVAHCFRNYAVFKGRAGRPEYWWFWVFLTSIGIVINVVKAASPTLGIALSWIWAAVTVVPHLAVASRRLHDVGRSFWWAVAPALTLLPILIIGFTKPAAV